MRVPSLLVASAIAVFGSAGCGGGGDTTINQTTTVIKEVPATTTDGEAETPSIETPSNQEFSGPCDAAREPTPTRTGFADLQVVEGPCEYAEQVAVAFADAYGPDCFDGCTKLVEGIRCETQPPTHAEVVCAAARTEVRFTISGED